MMGYYSVDRIIIGFGGIILCVILVDRLPDCAMCELDEFREGPKSNLIREISPMLMFIQEVIDINLNQRGVWSLLGRNYIQIQDIFIDLIMDMGVEFTSVLLLIILIHST